MRSDELLGGRYRLVERLGEGGMSVVWRGHDELLNRQVAIKVLATRHAADPRFRRRIRIEAQAAAKLSHPHIAGVYDYGEAPSDNGAMLPYVVMELVNGDSLASRLADGAPLPWPVAVTIAAQIASALAAAHARGVVHRDVTPGNIMLSADGAKVVDFGISALVGEQDADADGNILGTPAYLAPERIRGQPVSAATDVYALGLLLHRAVTGELPWDAATATEMLRAHCYAAPTPLPALAGLAGLPAAVVSLCERCLAKEPSARPASARLAEELWDALDGRPARALVPITAARPESVVGLSTSLLSWSTADIPPVALRQQATSRASRPAPRGRARLALAAAALILATGGIWAGTNWSSRGGTGRVADGVEAVSANAGALPVRCAVEYRLNRETRSTFAASIEVRNSGAVPIERWELSFDLPGDQHLVGGTGAVWTQNGTSLSARAPDNATLTPRADARLTLSARYHGSNPLPVAFRVNGSQCRATLLAASGAGGADPSRAGSGTRPSPGSRDSSAEASSNGASSGGASSGDDDDDGGKGKGRGRGKGKGSAQ
jgi:serine/threonine-protein kinase